MAKEKVKQWGLVMVVATWLLTTLSACGVSKFTSLELDFRYGRISVPTSIRDANEVIYVDGQSCPNELFWAKWRGLVYSRAVMREIMTFSQTTDKSGVQEIKHIAQDGFPFFNIEAATYIVDGKLHDGKFTTGIKYTYAASCNYKLKDFNYKVFRVVRNEHRNDRPEVVARVDDYIVGGKLKGVPLLVHRTYYTTNRRLELEDSMSVATSFEILYGKDSQ